MPSTGKNGCADPTHRNGRSGNTKGRSNSFARRSPRFWRVSAPTGPFPGIPNELRALRIIFHNRSSWLPTEECAVFRQAFHDELTRWEEARQLPEHEDIDAALLTRRTKPPALDCPIAEWEVAGISPIVDDENGVYGKLRPLPLDQDTYVLWPGAFEPRKPAPLPPEDASAKSGE